MARPARDGDDVGTNIRLPRHLLDRLDREADDRCIGRNLLIRRLLADGLDRLIPVEEALAQRPPPPDPESVT